MIERHTLSSGQPGTVPQPDLGTACSVRITYRQLILRGFGPTEAANLTAYLNGLAVAQQSWALDEVCHLLFLQKLNLNGQFGRFDVETRRVLA